MSIYDSGSDHQLDLPYAPSYFSILTTLRSVRKETNSKSTPGWSVSSQTLFDTEAEQDEISRKSRIDINRPVTAGRCLQVFDTASVESKKISNVSTSTSKKSLWFPFVDYTYTYFLNKIGPSKSKIETSLNGSLNGNDSLADSTGQISESVVCVVRSSTVKLNKDAVKKASSTPNVPSEPKSGIIKTFLLSMNNALKKVTSKNSRCSAPNSSPTEAISKPSIQSHLKSRRRHKAHHSDRKKQNGVNCISNKEATVSLLKAVTASKNKERRKRRVRDGQKHQEFPLKKNDSFLDSFFNWLLGEPKPKVSRRGHKTHRTLEGKNRELPPGNNRYIRRAERRR